jgi:hypothetical protein
MISKSRRSSATQHLCLALIPSCSACSLKFKPSNLLALFLLKLNVLDGLNEQQLPLKDELSDDFIFCQTIEAACGVALAQQLQLSSNSVSYRMKIGGQITGFAQVTKLYVLRDGAAKALNESCKY